MAPHHPDASWPDREGNLHLHFFKYAPLRRWHIWGYGRSLKSDVSLKPGVFAVLPLVAVSAILALRRLRPADFDVMHAHWLLPNGPLAALAAARAQPLLINLHGSDMYVAGKSAVFRRAARYALGRASAVVGCSEDLTSRARAILPERQIYHTLPYGVEESVFRPVEARSEGVVLAAGRLVEKKGFEYLLRALPLARSSVRLVLAGDGDLRKRLVELAAELGVSDRVEMRGELDQSGMVELYGSCPIFALPSCRDSGGNVDGLPNALLEAMSSGMAVVASRIGGVPAVVRDGENGLLVDEKDPGQIARAIDLLLSQPELRSRLGQAARQTIVDRFTWKRYALGLEGIMNEMRKRC